MINLFKKFLFHRHSSSQLFYTLPHVKNFNVKLLVTLITKNLKQLGIL